MRRLGEVIRLSDTGRGKHGRPEGPTSESIGQPPNDNTAALLIEQAYQEFSEICVNVVLTTSSLNHLNMSMDWRATHQHFRFVPASPVLLRMAISVDFCTAHFPELGAHAARFISRLSLAKAALRILVGDPTRLPGLRDRDKAADAWSGLSDAALLVLDDLENAVARLVTDNALFELTAHSAAIREALLVARDGGTPWHDGTLPERPEWAERRRCRRVPLNFDAELRYRGRQKAIRIRDVSEGGLGIEFCGTLKPAEIVVIVLENGRRFVGSVAWCHTNRAGILMAAPLSPSDPLLASS